MKAKLFAFIFATSLSGAAMAQCDVPEKPAIPDGTSASAAEMFKAKKSVDAYVETGQKILESCRLTQRRHNILLADLQEVASQFNENLKVYKERA